MTSLLYFERREFRHKIMHKMEGSVEDCSYRDTTTVRISQAVIIT